jgi:hypothetical protein
MDLSFEMKGRWFLVRKSPISKHEGLLSELPGKGRKR